MAEVKMHWNPELATISDTKKAYDTLHTIFQVAATEPDDTTLAEFVRDNLTRWNKTHA